MYSPNVNKLQSKKIRKESSKRNKICTPIKPQNKKNNIFPKDFFEEESLKKINSNEIKKEKNDGNILLKISCKIDSSVNSHSTNNTESGNFKEKKKENENINEIEEDIFNETPHFFPYVVKEKNIKHFKRNSENIKYKNKLIDGEKVNKEIKNLFNNIPENLKSDPDINKKVDLLLKNIYEMKKIIKSKKEEIKSPYKNTKSNNDIYKNNRPLSSRKLPSKNNFKGNLRYVKYDV